MSADDLRVRIADIQLRIASLSPRAVTAAPVRQVTATAATSGTQFAAALDTAMSATGAQTGQTAWVAPAQGKVTSEFGPRWGQNHDGMDIALGTGAPVRAASGGTVRLASWNGGYGNAVIIDHGNGVATLYGHNSALLVKPGERVAPGQLIAKAGSTGDSTGPHLHFEVQVNGKAIDPRPWLRERNVNL